MVQALASRAAAHDLDLVALAMTGDRAAFGELVRRHSASVRALLRRMGADPATADDIAQDAFLAAYEQIADFRGEGAFAAWVRRIAARLYVRRWRKATREALALEGSGETDAAEPPAVGADARLDLDEALKALTPSERLCVSLCYGAGLSHAEAAAALNAPLGTVKSHVKRGLDKLKARLGASSAEGGQEQESHG